MNPRERARLKRLGMIKQAVRKVEQRATAGQITQATARRQIERLLRAA